MVLNFSTYTRVYTVLLKVLYCTQGYSSRWPSLRPRALGKRRQELHGSVFDLAWGSGIGGEWCVVCGLVLILACTKKILCLIDKDS